MNNVWALTKICLAPLDTSKWAFIKRAFCALSYLPCSNIFMGNNLTWRYMTGILCLSLFCCALRCVPFGFAIIWTSKRELLVLLLLSFGCRVTGVTVNAL